MPFPEIARGPIQLPQAIENRSLNAMFRIGRERDFFVILIFGCRVKKTHHSGVYEVVQFRVNGKRSLHVRCNHCYKRQVPQDQGVPASVVGRRLVLAWGWFEIGRASCRERVMMWV